MSPTLHQTDPLIGRPAGRHTPRRALLALFAASGAAIIVIWAVVAVIAGVTTSSAGNAIAPETVSAVGTATSEVPDTETANAAAETATGTADAATQTATGDAAATEESGEVPATGPAAEAVVDEGYTDLAESEVAPGDECVMEPASLRIGSSGDSVACLQQALADAGYYSGPITGSYQNETYAAVEQLQIDRKLFVDGVAGRETGISLGIWPDEQMFVVRTPPPPPGATDLTGFPLSSVAVAGPDGPPLPQNSGDGRRIVYERISQRVWAVGDDGQVVRTWLVAGSQYSNEIPGTHYVYSKSEMSTAWNGAAYLPRMIRWLETARGHIGFHGIPYGVRDGVPYMTEDELGQRLSGGCQRMANLDAEFLWNWAPVGTKVVVL